MSNTTQHGNNIADQIQGCDAYGSSETLTIADVWLIVDNIHTHFLDSNRDTSIFERWMAELEDMDSDLPI